MDDERQRRIREQYDDRIAINPAFVCVAVTPDELHFRAGPASGPVFSVEDDDEDGVLGEFVPVLTGSRTLSEFAAAFDDAIVEELLAIVAELHARNIVFPATDDERSADEAAARGYVSLQDDFVADRHARLADRSVLVVTDGRIGEMIREDLTTMGAGSASIRYHPSAKRSDEPDCETVPDGDRFERLVESADLVVCASEGPRESLRERLNEAAYDLGTPWLTVQVIGFDGLIGPLVLPDDTACYECFKERLYPNVRRPDRYRLIETRSDESRRPRALPSFARTVAGLGATEALNYLADGVGFTAGRIVHYDFLDLAVEANDVLSLPRCSVCGADPVADEHQRHVTLERLVDRVMGDG